MITVYLSFNNFKIQYVSICKSVNIFGFGLMVKPKRNRMSPWAQKNSHTDKAVTVFVDSEYNGSYSLFLEELSKKTKNTAEH